VGSGASWHPPTGGHRPGRHRLLQARLCVMGSSYTPNFLYEAGMCCVAEICVGGEQPVHHAR
jgi:hypothetical protein